MGKLKEILTQKSEPQPEGVVDFKWYEQTSDFKGEKLVENDNQSSTPHSRSSEFTRPLIRVLPHNQQDPVDDLIEDDDPSKASFVKKMNREEVDRQSLPNGDLVTNMDLTDPAHVAELAARYAAMNSSMKRLAEEKANLQASLDRATMARKISEADIDALHLKNAELMKELGHAQEKLHIAMNSSGALFQKAALGVLKWGGSGMVLLFAFAFFYF